MAEDNLPFLLKFLPKQTNQQNHRDQPTNADQEHWGDFTHRQFCEHRITTPTQGGNDQKKVGCFVFRNQNLSRSFFNLNF